VPKDCKIIKSLSFLSTLVESFAFYFSNLN